MKNCKPASRYAEHVRYGRGEVVAVRQLDSGGFVADMKFGDGTERTLLIAAQFWPSGVPSLPPAAPKKTRKTQPE